MVLVPIKVKIGLNNEGGAQYPNFNSLPSVQDSGLDWSKYIDTKGSGWLYDSVGHKEVDPDSLFGEQWGMLLVPEEFATEAENTFPEAVEIIDEVEAEDFYNNRHAHQQPAEEIELETLQKIKLKQDLNIPLTQEDQEAIDPAHNRRGVRANKIKTFKGYKEVHGHTIKPNITRRNPRKTWAKPS